MGNILDYIVWRGDISFNTKPFNDIDSLVLCQLLYAEFDKIIPQEYKKSITLSDVEKNYFKKGLHKKNLGALINDGTADFLQLVANSERYSKVKLFGFINIIDTEQESQFAAVSALLPTNELCIIFRGTDDTLIGWKEDFYMSFLSPVPAQLFALQYIESVMKCNKKKTYVMGHSKGGNLAVYSSAYCDPKYFKQIVKVYDNDGPGFLSDVLEEAQYKQCVKKIVSITPESSVVGILLTKQNDITYIESSGRSGIAQHDIFTWQVEGTKVKTVKKQSSASSLTNKTVNTWLNNLKVEERKRFIDKFFDILSVTKATTLLEFSENWLQHSVAVIRTMNKLDKKTKNQFYKIMGHLFHAVQVNLPPIKELFSNE